MVIYNQTGQQLLNFTPSDSSYHFQQITGQNHLYLKFSLNYFMEFPAGAYCYYDGEQYILFTPDEFVKQHSEHYDYT
jgi:hypothetical protein